MKGLHEVCMRQRRKSLKCIQAPQISLQVQHEAVRPNPNRCVLN